MHLAKLLHSKTGKYVLSVILGLGLASLFRTVCKGKNCLAFKAPPLDEIKDKTFKFNNKCYKYEASQTSCDKNKKIVQYS
jgi:hypothetical protein